MTKVPELRVRSANGLLMAEQGEYVLYWMTMARRTHWNFALDRAIELAEQLRKPLVVSEALRCGYGWASDRLHRFILEGMADNARRLKSTDVLYYPYVEPEPDADKGLLAALARRACVVITDDFPAFFLPRMLASAAKWLSVRLEVVDSNGILPLRATDQVFPTAFAFRRFLQKNLSAHFGAMPNADPIKRAKLSAKSTLPPAILKRWPPADLKSLLDERGLAALPIDHRVLPTSFAGGPKAADATLDHFLNAQLDRYLEYRNEPEKDATSGLSPYLHFGHISAHEVFHRLMECEKWSPEKLDGKPAGKRSGWWGASENAEAFLDQLITWRELGYNLCAHREDYDQYESLPDWAKTTLEKHARDRRPVLYALEELEQAKTYDPLWNAAQRQLVREGRMHNYLRMLWGKKILEWSASPREALASMIELNNKFAVDGRNPNSYSGIFWCLGRYDRAWGPERPVFGKIRYMSSGNTARKLSVKGYMERYAH